MGGKAKALPDGHPRRMSDGKNAWRKMSLEQRRDFLDWISADLSPMLLELVPLCPRHGRGCWDAYCKDRASHHDSH